MIPDNPQERIADLWTHLFEGLEGYLVTFTGQQSARPDARPNELAAPQQRSWRWPTQAEAAADYLLEQSQAGRELRRISILGTSVNKILSRFIADSSLSAVMDGGSNSVGVAIERGVTHEAHDCVVDGGCSHGNGGDSSGFSPRHHRTRPRCY